MRQATKYDKTEIIELMKAFRSEADIEELKGEDNEPYWQRLLDTILAGAGIVFIEEGKGLLMALITHSVWCDKTLFMQELAWYVKPEFRHTSLGYRLLKAYVEHGKSLKQSGRIKYFCIAKLPSSPDIKYDRFGFRKLDDNWMQ